MKLIKPSFDILFISPKPLETIEMAGRTCYKSEDKITKNSAEKFIKMIIKNSHYSVIEHVNMSVRIICDRGVSHEIVRHRLVSYSQESTRYCNYAGEVTFIIPPWIDIEEGEYALPYYEDQPGYPELFWYKSLIHAEKEYKNLLYSGWSPQQARSVLPNSLKTEIIVSANMREWIHIFKLRTSKAAHPQMREIMIPLLKEVERKIPIIFDDINKSPLMI